MKVLDFALAPNPKKVRVYMREKGLDIPIEQVDVMGGKNRTPEFLSGEVLVGLSRNLPNFLVDLSDGGLRLPALSLPLGLELGPLRIPVWLCACGTVAVEAALATGFWIPRLRIATAALGVAFHASLRHVLVIGWLDWICVFLYLAFLLPFERDPGRPPGGRTRERRTR